MAWVLKLNCFWPLLGSSNFSSFCFALAYYHCFSTGIENFLHFESRWKKKKKKFFDVICLFFWCEDEKWFLFRFFLFICFCSLATTNRNSTGNIWSTIDEICTDFLMDYVRCRSDEKGVENKWLKYVIFESNILSL